MSTRALRLALLASIPCALLAACGSRRADAPLETTTTPATDPAPEVPAPPRRHYDRHALDGGPEAKAPHPREIRSAFLALVIAGDADAQSFRDLVAELSTLGTEDAAAEAIALAGDPRIAFEGHDAAFRAALEALAPAVRDEALRAELERTLRALRGEEEEARD